MMPHDTTAESYVLGSLMLHSDVIDEWDELSGEYFFLPAHQTILSAIIAIRASGGSPDLLTVTQRLNERGEMESVGGPGVLTEMYGSCGGRDMGYHVAILRDYMARRRIIVAANKMLLSAKDLSTNAEEALADAGESILGIDMGGKRDSAVAASEMIHGVMVDMERSILEKGKPRGIPTGYRDFDYMTGGLRGGQLILVSGRPGMGKSAMLMNIADRMVANGIETLCYSLEMKRNDLMKRIICARAKVSSTRLRNGAIGREEQRRIMSESAQLAEQPLFIDDLEAPTIYELRARARKEVRKHGIKCILVDYLGLIRVAGATVKSRENEVGMVSRGLKAMAMELDIPVIAAAQLNRASELRTDVRPKLSDLRDSGSLEQDADIVTTIYREGYYDKTDNGSDPQPAEWDVVKHREGKTGTMHLVWHPEWTRFDEAQITRLTDESSMPAEEQQSISYVNSTLNE
jgi:replicative DNA helicase